MKGRFLQILTERFVYLKNQKMLVGFSGGADSVFLLHILNDIKKQMGLDIFAVHVNHQLRGKESDEDEKFTRKFCKNLGIKLFVKKIELNSDKSIEEKARNIRYEIFEKIAKKNNIKFCITAHNSCDDVETILLNIFRGTGLFGLEGIEDFRPISKNSEILLLRPILDFSKQEILMYLVAENLEFRQDSSNSDIKFARNRLRNKILPEILKINPKAQKHILNLKQIAKENNEVMNDFLKDKIKDVLVKENSKNIVIDFSRYMVYNKQIKKMILSYFLKGKANFLHMSQAFEKIENSNNGRYSLDLKNGYVIKRLKKKLVIKHKGVEFE